MSARPHLLTLEINPGSRYDAIDVSCRIAERFGAALDGYRRVLYCSHHTTAGYLDQSVACRLGGMAPGVEPFFDGFRALFPYRAGYRHDDLESRNELSAEQRLVEPPNGDAHLMFIGSGLQNCVTYDHEPGAPVFFFELDGVHQGRVRTRTTSVIAYSEEEPVAEVRVDVPVSHHPIDSVNLADRRLELHARIDELLAAHPVAHGRLDIALDGDEQAAAVTVNEYETLLMRHDLAEVLRNPFRFVARQGRRMLRHPRAVPAKSIGYARYDVVQVLNGVIDTLGLQGTAVERLVSRFMAIPASRMLRFKRRLCLPVTRPGHGRPMVVRGRYQSPILIQWQATPRRARSLKVTLTQLK